MKKTKLLLVLPVALLIGSLAGCGNKGGGGGSSGDYPIKDGLLDLGDEFNSAYYPKLTSIDKTLTGKIDVVLVFEGKTSGWRAVADEYERLHEGSVIVKLNDNFTAETYYDNVKQQLTGGNTDWDVIQGNLMGGLSKDTYTYDMQNSIYSKNAYANDKNWNAVLQKNAYTSDSSKSDNVYILNSENLQTAWFVNKVALQVAKNNGYVKENKSATNDNPETWNDLISLCTAMKKGGYNYPLGLSLDKDSITASQFSWLLRVYGDYFYRGDYNHIADTYPNYTLDVTDKSPETNLENPFEYSITRLFNTILDNTSSFYSGAESDKFGDFLEQFVKIKDFIRPSAYGTSFNIMRNNFQTQSEGKDSPQIFLDYAGNGLGFESAKAEGKFDIDFFDHPKVKSQYVDEQTILRDVGGNGGYLSIAKHKDNEYQDKLTLDFLKFFMSPYAQTIYYHALEKANLYPQGITLVTNRLVVIPSRWKTYFDTDKISFNGLADSNPYITFLIRFMSTSGKKTTENCTRMWSDLITGGGKASTYSKADFQSEWAGYLRTDWKDYANSQGYDPNCYLYPGSDPFNPLGE